MKLHNKNHLIKSVLGNLEFSLLNSGLKKNELIVVNYHGTQAKFDSNFRIQIKFFLKNFTLLSPKQLPDFYSGKHVGEKPLLLITFDDGVKNNLNAAKILDEYNLKAFFFVVPEFIDTPYQKQKEYFIIHIRPEINPLIDFEKSDFTSLTWDDIIELKASGHFIGSHTNTHTLVAKKSSIENSKKEIIDSKVTIAKKLDLPANDIDAFCSINNTLESISAKELKLIKENYNFHFTTIPGPNLSNGNPLFIKRSNIEAHWLLGAVKYAIGKWDLKRWEIKTADFFKMIEQSK